MVKFEIHKQDTDIIFDVEVLDISDIVSIPSITHILIKNNTVHIATTD